jgi:hypothetical protein
MCIAILAGFRERGYYKGMPQAHYYGDSMRALLIAVAVIMLITMPFFTGLLPQPLFFSVLAVLGLVILAGLVSPRHKWVVAVSTFAAALAFIAFQLYALSAFRQLGFGSAFFLVNELLALLSIIATYLGIKSVRGLNLAEGL